MPEPVKLNSGNELTTAEGDLRTLVTSLAQHNPGRRFRSRLSAASIMRLHRPAGAP